jgi:hypothetical protein
MKKYLQKILSFFKYCPITSVQYDSQDNLVKIDNGRWQQSWNLETGQPQNPVIAIYYDWNHKRLRIVTPMAGSITQVKVQGKVCPFSRSGNNLFVTYDDMHWWMNNSDLFYIDLKRY